MEEHLEDQWWQSTWRERYECLRSHLDPMIMPDQIMSFKWDSLEEATPGGSAIAFAPRQHPDRFTVVSMGLTQPLAPGDSASEWEFALHPRVIDEWCYRLIRDLMVGCRLCGKLTLGHFLPINFFSNTSGEIDCVTAEMPKEVERVSSMIGLYLWPSLIDRQLFEVSTGDFHLMAVTLVNRDEELLADQTSPPHLLLLLKELGHLQPCDPWRSSALSHPCFSTMWDAIRRLSEDEAFSRLCA
jgi:hypothetical protein